MSTTPYNEAGITATFAAIFARLDALEANAARDADYVAAVIRSADARIRELEASTIRKSPAPWPPLESARIAAPVAPESAETGPGVSREPRNATAAHGGDPIDFYDPKLWDAIAAHIHRPHGGFPYDSANVDHCTDIAEIVCEAIAFIQRDEDNTWLKEGEPPDRLAVIRPDGRLAVVDYPGWRYQWADAGDVVRWLLGDEAPSTDTASEREEVAAALRMYRKVQRLQACDDIFGFGVKMDTFLHFQYAAPLLAWLKEGEAQ